MVRVRAVRDRWLPMRHALLAGLVAAVASAGAAFANVAGAPPAAGTWKVSGEGGGPVRGGHFVVTNHKTVRDFTMTFDPNFAEGCGTVSVVGQQRIYDARGTNIEHIHYSDWVVGTNHPHSGTVIQPEKVTVEQNGKQLSGGLSLAWTRPPRSGPVMHDGTLKFRLPNHRTCSTNFTFNKA